MSDRSRDIVPESELPASMAALRQRIEELERDKQDLEVMLSAATEHADIVAEDLVKERDDLTTMLEMTTEHADTVEEELHERAAAAVRRNEQQLRMIVEATPVPVIITRRSDGAIVYANAMLGLLLGVNTGELLGRAVVDFYFDPAERRDIMSALELEGALDDREVRFARPDGGLVWVEMSLRLLDFNDQPSVLSALHDITFRKQAEIRLHQQVEELRLELEETNLSSRIAKESGTTRFQNLDAIFVKSGATRIVGVHSFQGGNGRSSITANLAGLLAAGGQRVGVVDADIQAPGIHLLLGQAGRNGNHTLNDFLADNCSIHQLAIDVTDGLGADIAGRLFFIPASVNPGTMAHVLSQGYDSQRLTQVFQELASLLQLDVLLIDTHPGMNEEALLTMRSVDTLIVVLRPSQRDFEGTGVTIQVARQLEVPKIMLLINQLADTGQLQAVRTRVEAAFNNEVMAVLPYASEFMSYDGEGLFALQLPNHPVSTALRQAAAKLTMAHA